MRKALFLLLILLAACKMPVDGVNGINGRDGIPGEAGADGAPGKDAPVVVPNVHVVNSDWQIVFETSLTDRSITSTDFIDKMVSDYNATNNADQWRIIYGDVPDIRNAPTADAYIIDASLEKLVECHGVARSAVSSKRTEMESVAKAKAGTLYIDKTPPEPAPVPVVTDYERYAIYLVAADGHIIAEEHATADTFALRVSLYQLQAQGDGQGEYVISGRLYP